MASAIVIDVLFLVLVLVSSKFESSHNKANTFFLSKTLGANVLALPIKIL